MAVVTIYRLAEQAYSLIEGGDPGAASSISFNEIKISCGQVINQLLRTDYLATNFKLGEIIPNQSVVARYDNIPVTQLSNGTSKAVLPIKPLTLPRNMGVWSIYTPEDPYQEFIPLQMGQSSLLRSQLMINELLGQVGYETRGIDVYFTKDITQGGQATTVDMELVVMDISQYGDYDVLPVPPDMEWQIIQEVYKLYITQPLADKVVSATSKEEKNIPLNQQSQS
jgi:hypothetical protein